MVERLVGAAASARGLVVIDGDRTLIKAWGNRRHEPPLPFTESTRFELGSVSKVLAGLLFADAVARGELGWTDALARRVAAVRVAEYPGTPITLLDVATQSVGFPMMPDNWRKRTQDLSGPEYTLDQFREYLAGFHHPFRPGSAYSYSNVNTALVAMALSERTSKPYDELLRERIFQPLGMSSSSFASRPPDSDEVLEGWVEGLPYKPRVDASPLASCCVVRTTLTDVARFMRAAAGGEAGTLRRAFDDLAEPRLRVDDRGDEWATLGWLLHARSGMLWKNGVVAGQRCKMGVVPARRQALFLIVNDDSVDVDGITADLAQALFRPTLDLDPAAHGRFVVGAVPPDTTRTDANFANTMQLVAWSAPARLRAGETGRIRLYFRSLAKTERDWKLFVHADNAGTKRRFWADHFPGGGADSTAFWQPGEIILDEFALQVPSDADSGAVDVWLGFYHFGSRAPVVSAATRSEKNRVLGPRIAIDGRPKKRR